ncbi:MAG: LysR family transcriptional regulator [Pseudomonadota bacterium]
MSGLEVFLAVADGGSLRAAARALGVQPPAVSHQLKAFETELGVTLFARTTRSLSLTDAGRALLRRARPAVGELNAALEEARGIGSAAKGTLRLTLPYVAHQITLAPRLAAFREAYPEIELELSFDDAFVDIIAEGFQGGIRLGDLIQENMIAVRLSPPVNVAYFASPAYLARHGRPLQPSDLLGHRCIYYRYIGSQRLAEWEFQGKEGPTSVKVTGGLIVNSTSALVRAACDGLGIAWLFRPAIDAEVAAGRLECLLEDYAPERPGYFLYYPKENAQLEVMRRFIDFMKLTAERSAGRPGDRALRQG